MTEEDTDQEKAPDELKELFETRRKEGKEDEEILREVFETNSDADIKRLVELTGLPSLTIGRIKGQVSIRRKRDSRAAEKHQEHLEEGELNEADARQLVAQTGREGLNKIKRAFLKKTLAIAPQMTDKAAEWILHKWDINPRIRDDPNEFYAMLHNDTGLKPNTAISIVHDVFGLEEQYADILENRGEKPIFISGGPRDSGQPEGEFSRRDYGQSAGRVFEVSGRGGRRDSEGSEVMTLEIYRRLEREKEEKTRTQRLEEKVDSLTGSLGNLKDEIVKELGSKKPSDETSVEEIPIDADGKPTSAEAAVSVKRITRGGGIPRADPLDTYLKMRQLDKLDKTGQLDAEGVRRILREEGGGKKETPPEITQLQNQMTGLSDQIKERDRKLDELKDKLTEQEKNALKDEIQGMKNEMARLADKISSGGVSSVEGMLTSVGGKLVDKTPLKEAGQIVRELLTPSGSVITPTAQAPPVTSTPPETDSVLATLRARGLVTTVRERIGERQ